MVIAQVWYTVPVCALVDTETREVRRVVVIDESVELDLSEGVADESYSGRVKPKVARRALEIAEAQEWPAWEFGF